MLKIQVFQFNNFQANCYVIWDSTGECVICDPCALERTEKDTLTGFIADNGLKVKALIVTHGHADHTYFVKEAADLYGAPVYMSLADIPVMAEHAGFCRKLGMPELRCDFKVSGVKEEDRIRFGEHEFVVIETPGHTPGGVCYLCIEERLLLSGDTLFRGTIGRTDLPGGDFDTLIGNIRGKLMGLRGDIDVLPGHGPGTTIADEIQSNPFLEPFNEEVDMDEAAANAIEPGFDR